MNKKPLEPGKLYEVVPLGIRSGSGVVYAGNILMFIKSEIYYKSRLSGSDRLCRFTFLNLNGDKAVFSRPSGWRDRMFVQFAQNFQKISDGNTQ